MWLIRLTITGVKRVSNCRMLLLSQTSRSAGLETPPNDKLTIENDDAEMIVSVLRIEQISFEERVIQVFDRITYTIHKASQNVY